MADANIEANAGSGGAKFSVDDDGTQVWPYCKLAWGASGTRNEVDDATGKRLPVKAVLEPSADGALSNYHKVAVGSTNADTIKNAPGQVYQISVFNNAGYPIFVKLFDKASNPTVGTDTPYRTIGVQAGTQRDIPIPNGLKFATGIAIAMTKLITDADTTAILANDAVVDIAYA